MGIAGWPIKMKRLNVVVTGPQAALSDSFISGVLRWGLNGGWRRGRGSAGDTLFPKSVRVNSAVHSQGRRYKSKQKQASACPSPNLLLMSHKYSLHTGFHLRLKEFLPRVLFITNVARKLKKKIKNKKVRKSSAKRLQPKGTMLFLDSSSKGIMIEVGHSPDNYCNGNLLDWSLSLKSVSYFSFAMIWFEPQE